MKTFDQLFAQGASNTDMVREFFPHMSKDEAEYYLWEETPFPMVQGKYLYSWIENSLNSDK